MCEFALVHQGSWKNDSKHQIGKLPPARTDRLMFVYISPVTVFNSVSICVSPCICVREKYIISPTLQLFTNPEAAQIRLKP